MRIGDLFPSRLTMAAGIGCAVFIPLAIFSSYRWGVTHHDLVQEQGRSAELHAQINAPGIGYKDRLTMAHANLAGAQAALATQNKAVDALKAAAAQESPEQVEQRIQQAIRGIRRALLLGLGLVMGLYLLANWAYLRVLGVAGLAASDAPAAALMRTAFGPVRLGALASGASRALTAKEADLIRAQVAGSAR
mgnify:CR=1 FL=1